MREVEGTNGQVANFTACDRDRLSTSIHAAIVPC
jgi:hypothetical protein